MAADLWRRIWRRASPARGASTARRSRCGRDIASAAARGEPIETLLELAAHSLLEADRAARAGVWLLHETGAESGDDPVRGCVVDSSGLPPPVEWNRLDLPASFLAELMQSAEPLIVGVDGRSSGATPIFPPVGPFADAKRVVWLPLRVADTPLGIGMLAGGRWRPGRDESALRAIAEQLSLALILRHERTRRLACEEDLDERARLERSIQRGVAVDAILAEIAAALERASGAEFVVVGRKGSAGESAAWVGTPGWRGMLTQERLLQLWAAAVEEGKAIDIEAGSLRWPGRDGPANPDHAGKPERSSARVVTMPLVASGVTLGVLVAGLGSATLGNDEMRRLECYGGLAAAALHRDLIQIESSSLAAAFGQWIENTPEQLLVVNTSGQIEQSSRIARAALGLGAPQAARMRLADLFAEGVGQAIEEWLSALPARLPEGLSGTHPPNRPCAAPPLDALMSTGVAVRVSLRAQMPSARPPARSWLVALEALSSAEALDRVDCDRAMAELNGLLDSLDSGVLVFDDSGAIRAANDRFAQIMGLDPRILREMGGFERLVEFLSARFAHPVEFAARWRERLERSDEPSWDELELARPARRILERFARPVRGARGARLGWIEVYRDITSQRLIQAKLRQAEKMAAVGQMVSGIAHELNNPLTSIQGYAQLLVSRRPGLERQADATRICEEAERAGRIVKNLLLFAREATPERRSMDLNEVVERAFALRSYELKLENIQVELDLEPGLPAILGDASQMLQVILNLVVNAEQAMGQQNRHPDDQSLERGRIRIRTRRVSEQRLALEISDNGPGIPPEQISRIFDPFFTTKPPGVGTGLGLSIVYGIVHEHGGEITVQSEIGHGATFAVALPVRGTSEGPPPADLSGDFAGALSGAAIASDATPMAASAGSASRPGGRGERILVIEDEPTVAHLIADVLADEGHRVDKLLDSREAIERVRKHSYDLVICDLKMPYVDGRDFYRALVNAESPLQHRLVFVTGDTLSPHTLEFLESSGLPYLAKPFLVEELKRAVQQAVARLHGELRRGGAENSWQRASARKQPR